MSEIIEQSRKVLEPVQWAKAEGKHAEMHLIRRAALLAVDAVVQHVGIDETASSEEQLSSYTPTGRWLQKLKRPQYTTRIGSGERLIVSNFIPLGQQENPEDPAMPYEFARIEQEGRFNFEKTYYRVRKGQPKRCEDLHYQPDIVVRHFSGRGIANTTAAHEITNKEVRMMNNPNIDVRPMMQWSPEAMVDHYQRQIEELKIFIGEVVRLAEASGAYIHSGTHLTYYLEEDIRYSDLRRFQEKSSV